jgi:hypothetical protein
MFTLYLGTRSTPISLLPGRLMRKQSLRLLQRAAAKLLAITHPRSSPATRVRLLPQLT